MSSRDVLSLFGGELEDQATLYEKVQDLEKQLSEARSQILALSHDCVSGLVTRTTFETHLKGMFQSCRRGDQPLGIIMCDIDHFKEVNDQYNHRAGDEALNRVAATVQSCVRATDIAARYGGDEFVCILANIDARGTAVMCERIRREVSQLRVPGLPRVTISAGFALQSAGDTSGEDIVARADEALCRAKRLGRNRVESQR